MLEAMFESTVKEKILLFLHVNDGSYPSEIARNFSFNINAVQFQLKKLETAGVLYSQLRGKVRLYGLKQDYPFRRELQSLLGKALALLGSEERDKYYVIRPQLRQAVTSYERFLPDKGAEADAYQRQPDRPGMGEKAVEKSKNAPKPQYLPRKVEPLDFSID